MKDDKDNDVNWIKLFKQDAIVIVLPLIGACIGCLFILSIKEIL